MQRLGLVALLASVAGGCVTQTIQTTEEAVGPNVAPALVVERFLRAVNANDLDTMARLFGTRAGSILRRDPRREVEQRMFVLASVLRHDDYELQGEQLAPGRLGEAVRIAVLMKFGTSVVSVPFTVVRTDEDSWLVEQVDIERITGRGG